MKNSILTLLGVALWGPSMAGCGDPGAECGEGTVQVGDTCRPVVERCDPGTTREVDGACVPLPDEVDPVPESWTCPPANYGSGEHCDCECGAHDPDCALDLVVIGCHDPTVACLPSGRCETQLPEAWSCSSEAYEDGLVCDCACGAPDPDCALDPFHEMRGCASGICNPDGTCGACTPACGDRVCGDDGCGGSCGACLDPDSPYCVDGACAGECRPECGDHTCGPDGCGGECGTCGEGETCSFGYCRAPDPEVSCVGRCGELAPGGCSCADDCGPGVDCCEDHAWACPATTHQLVLTAHDIPPGEVVVLGVSGIAGQAFALADNDVAVPLPIAFEDGAAWALELVEHPSRPCTLSSSSGGIMGADVEVTIDCAPDRTLYRLVVTATGIAADEAVVLEANGAGNVRVATVSGNDVAFEVVEALMADGAPWSATILLGPSALPCSLSAESGTVVGADVLLALTCP